MSETESDGDTARDRVKENERVLNVLCRVCNMGSNPRSSVSEIGSIAYPYPLPSLVPSLLSPYPDTQSISPGPTVCLFGWNFVKRDKCKWCRGRERGRESEGLRERERPHTGQVLRGGGKRSGTEEVGGIGEDGERRQMEEKRGTWCFSAPERVYHGTVSVVRTGGT